MLMLAIGFLAGWCLCILLDPRARAAHRGIGKPPICRYCGCADPVSTALHNHDTDMLLRDCLKWLDEGGDASVEDRVRRARLIERLVEALNIPVQNPASDPGLRT